MSRRRAGCGQLTADGTQCKNGPGCAVNHRIGPDGQVTAMTLAFRGPGVDPFAAGPLAPAADAASLDDVLETLLSEAGGDPQLCGRLFEPVAIKWLTQVDPATPLGTFSRRQFGDAKEPTHGDIKEVTPWEVWDGSPDDGIDAVATMKDGTLAAIQIKTGGVDLIKKNIDSFVGEATVPDENDAKRFKYRVLIYTNPGMSQSAARLFMKHSGVLIVGRDHLEGAEPDGGWQKLLDETQQERASSIKEPRRSKNAGGDGSAPAGTSGRKGPRNHRSWDEIAASVNERPAGRRAGQDRPTAAQPETEQQKSQRQHAALPRQLADRGLGQGDLAQQLDDTVGSPAAAYEDVDVLAAAAVAGDQGAGLELAARQTVLYEYHLAAAKAVNRRRKVTMSILRDDHELVASVLARLVTVFTPAAKMTEVRAKAAAKAAAKGEDFNPASVDAVVPTRVQQMAIEGAEIRGTKKKKEKKRSGRPKQPEERRLATVSKQLGKMKRTNPDQFDRLIALVGDEADEVSP